MNVYSEKNSDSRQTDARVNWIQVNFTSGRSIKIDDNNGGWVITVDHREKFLKVELKVDDDHVEIYSFQHENIEHYVKSLINPTKPSM